MKKPSGNQAMHEDSERSEQEPELSAQLSQAEPTVNSRRLLLTGVAGGLIMAASGLVLPEWIQEAEAREGALGGAKGGRRGKDRRGRHKRRPHGDKNGNSKVGDRPILNIRGISYSVEVSGQQGIKGDLYLIKFRPGERDFWELKDTKTLEPPAGGTIATPRSDAALWINDRILVRATNDPILEPNLTIGHGGAFWAGERGWQDGTVVFDERLLKDRSSPAFTLEGYGVRVERLQEDHDSIRYKIAISKN